MGYLVAVLIEIGAVSGSLLLVHSFSPFALPGALVLLGIIVVALNWGEGPGLLATFVGIVQLDVFVLFPYLPMSLRTMADSLSLLLFWLIGLSISLIAGRSGRVRRQAEELAHSLKVERVRSDVEHQRLRTLLEVLPAAVGMVDAQGRFLEINLAAQALWGNESFPREIAQLQAHRGWWPDTGTPLAAEEWAIVRALTRGETILNEEVVEFVDGQHKVIGHSAAPIRDATGAIRGAAGVLQDTTERKRTEREIAEHAAQLEAILENIADGLIVTDAHGRLLHLNQSYRTLLGLDADPKGVTLPALQQIAGHALYNVRGQPLTEVERPLNRILHGEVLTGTKHVDLMVRTRDGRELRLNVSGAPIHDMSGHLLGTVQVLRDVTEQHRLEQRTRQALQALLAMAKALVEVDIEGDSPRLPEKPGFP